MDMPDTRGTCQGDGSGYFSIMPVIIMVFHHRIKAYRLGSHVDQQGDVDNLIAEVYTSPIYYQES
jgi:hypothetical protein